MVLMSTNRCRCHVASQGIEAYNKKSTSSFSFIASYVFSAIHIVTILMSSFLWSAVHYLQYQGAPMGHSYFCLVNVPS